MQRGIIFTFLTLLFISCTPPPAASLAPTLVYVQDEQLVTVANFSPGTTFTPTPLDFAPPPGCSIWSLHPAPQGAYLAVLLDCTDGPLTLVVDLTSKKSGSPLKEPADSRFLTWSTDGTQIYLLVDSLGEPRLLQIDLQHGRSRRLSLPGSTYALAPSPDGQTLAYAQTPGIGFGSELWTAGLDGKNARRLLSDPENTLVLPRWSPDGKSLAYIRMPDTQTPFPNGELWLLEAATGQAHFLAAADAGHGYAPAWSPDGKSIAFVTRENPDDPLVAQQAGNLRSNIYVLRVAPWEGETGMGTRSALTRLENSQTGTPVWSPDGRSVIFTAVLDGKMNLWIHTLAADETRPLTEAGACCPAWIGK